MIRFDGAMGTMLQQGGLAPGACPELLNLDQPELVQAVHRAYLEAGAQVLTTNTFGGSPLKLAEYGLENRCTAINAAAVANARAAIEATGVPAKIAGDLGPTGHFMAPLGPSTWDDIYTAYRTQADALVAAGVDFLLLETIIDIQEMRAALLAALDARTAAGLSKDDCPIICQMAYGEDGRTVTGTDPETATLLLDAMGADILGANCSLGPAQLLPLLQAMGRVTDKPLIVQPNAGLPILEDGKTVFPLSPEEMARYVAPMYEAGVRYMGGCCGTTPAHIAALQEAMEALGPQPAKKPVPARTALTSRTRTLYIGQGEPPIMIGERINPTGRKALAAELATGSLQTVKRDALAQVDAGAAVLDVNMGVPNVDQVRLMREAITTLSSLVEVPLSIDSMAPAAIEAGLQAYPGRALINSVNAEPEQLAAILPLAKRYGAALLCLPLGRGDLPATAEERLALVDTIVTAAYEAGLRPQDLLLDPLVLTLAAGPDSARETLRTLALYRERYGFPTVMGLSNISFGLPQRPYLNGQFLSMALTHGLTCPIMNPLNYAARKAFAGALALLGYDTGAADFIGMYGQEQEGQAVNPTATRTAATYDTTDLVSALREAIMQGDAERAATFAAEALAAGIDPLTLTRDSMSRAMEIVGEGFGAGRVFLPQVMLCAEAMQAAFARIQEALPIDATTKRAKVLLATVKGDIHDLGKQIVAALLENNGFAVIDLGKDVDPAVLVEAVATHQPDVVGLASLMTTTLPQVDATIAALRAAGHQVPVMIGGAVVTEAYAQQAGADRYVRDGVQAVAITRSLVKGGTDVSS